jgi:hypothetical protein
MLQQLGLACGSSGAKASVATNASKKRTHEKKERSAKQLHTRKSRRLEVNF